MPRLQKFDRATYYINVSSALLIAGSIFLLAVVTALGFDEKSINLKLFLIGAMPLGIAAVLHGMTYYFKAQQVIQEEQIIFPRMTEKQRDMIYGVTIILSLYFSFYVVAPIIDPNFSYFQPPMPLILGLTSALVIMAIPAIHAHYVQEEKRK